MSFFVFVKFPLTKMNLVYIIINKSEVTTLSIGKQIKKLRKELDLTQQKFGERIGVKGNTIAQYELGRNEPIDAVLSLICREYNVNKDWLLTGEGEMFNTPSTDVLDQLARDYNLSNSAYIMIEKFINLKPEVQNAIYDFFREVTTAISDDNANTNKKSNNSSPSEFSMNSLVQDWHENIPDTPEELEKLYPPIDDSKQDIG